MWWTACFQFLVWFLKQKLIVPDFRRVCLLLHYWCTHCMYMMVQIFMAILVSISNFISLRSAISFFFGDDDSSLYSYTLFLQTFQFKVINFELWCKGDIFIFHFKSANLAAAWFGKKDFLLEDLVSNLTGRILILSNEHITMVTIIKTCLIRYRDAYSLCIYLEPTNNGHDVFIDYVDEAVYDNNRFYIPLGTVLQLHIRVEWIHPRDDQWVEWYMAR